VSEVIDVVVPVYLGVKETMNCLNAIVKAKTDLKYRLLIINDCSPDDKIYKHLKCFVSEYEHVVLYENSVNLGFVKTVNKGMKLSTTNDVILLNADTEVSDFWLDKMHRVMSLSPDVATVTPFSNQATIFSFPVMNPKSDSPQISSIECVNKLLEKHNSECSFEVPTAHGFCMLIRRSTLQDIGFFDEDKWGKGYCEENDFSIRAQLNGWRNVIACDTYVKHVGSVSFQEESVPRINKNLALLNALYPLYLEQVADFLLEDPLSVYRLPVLEELLISKTRSKRHIFLHVIHSLGGGTEHAMRTLINKTKGIDVCSIVLRSMNRGRIWRIECEDQVVIIDFVVTQGIDKVLSLLKKISISHIHYHQVLEFNLNVRSLPEILSCEYDISLHDYYLLCPRVNLLNASGELCDGPEVSKCNLCIKNSGSYTNENLNSENNIKTFFDNNHHFLKAARLNIAPTVGVKTLFSSFIASTNIVVKAHPEKLVKRNFITTSNTSIVNIAILGALGEHKGSKLLKELILFADKYKLPLCFVVVGYGNEELNELKSERLIFSGEYKLEELPDLIKRFECERALFISPWPETYSYTLSEALQLGLYPFALNLGAFKDRLSEYGIGTLISVTANEKEICRLLQLAPSNVDKYSLGIEYKSIIDDYYNINLN